jgi:hypothetical protein
LKVSFFDARREKTLGHERRLRAKIVNYADDFVICCRGTAVRAMTEMQAMMERLKLTVNVESIQFSFRSFPFFASQEAGRLWCERWVPRLK